MKSRAEERFCWIRSIRSICSFTFCPSQCKVTEYFGQHSRLQQKQSAFQRSLSSVATPLGLILRARSDSCGVGMLRLAPPAARLTSRSDVWVHALKFLMHASTSAALAAADMLNFDSPARKKNVSSSERFETSFFQTEETSFNLVNLPQSKNGDELLDVRDGRGDCFDGVVESATQTPRSSPYQVLETAWGDQASPPPL